MEREQFQKLATSTAEGLLGNHAHCLRDLDARVRAQDAEIVELKQAVGQLAAAKTNQAPSRDRFRDADTPPPPAPPSAEPKGDPPPASDGKGRNGKRSG